MKLRKVKVADIKVPEVRVTARMDEETAAQFKESIKTVGIDEPPKVYDVDGVFYLSDGLHRLNEAKAAGMTWIEVYVREGTYEDVVCNNLQSGHLRGKHPVSEMIRSVAYLWQEKSYDSIKIHEKTGLSQDYVEKLQKLSRLTSLILAGLDEGLINVGQAFALTRIADPVTQESVYHTVKQYRFKGKELDGFIDDVLKIESAKAQSTTVTAAAVPAMLKCEYCGAEGRPGEIATPNTCAACSLAMRQSVAIARAEIEAEAKAKNPLPGETS